jgi:hypothetical protein
MLNCKFFLVRTLQVVGGVEEGVEVEDEASELTVLCRGLGELDPCNVKTLKD